MKPLDTDWVDYSILEQFDSLPVLEGYLNWKYWEEESKILVDLFKQKLNNTLWEQ